MDPFEDACCMDPGNLRYVGMAWGEWEAFECAECGKHWLKDEGKMRRTERGVDPLGGRR